MGRVARSCPLRVWPGPQRAAHPCDRLTWRNQGAKDKGRFWGLAGKEKRQDPDDHTRTYAERTVFVFSQGERRAIRHARAKALCKTRAGLRHVRAQLNRGRYQTRDYILRQLNQRLGSGAPFVTYQLDDVQDESGQTRFALSWKLDRQALRQAAEFDGWYRLLTNVSETEYPMGQVLALYKGHAHAEDAFKQIKHYPHTYRVVPQALDSAGNPLPWFDFP